jgi:predicted 2-oxoglutarate/Fe(II)-dependent dioxygenase YbiX
MQEIIPHKVWTLKSFLTSNECQDFRNTIDNAASQRSFSCSGEFYNSVFKDHAIADMFLGRLLTYDIPSNIVNVAPYITFAHYQNQQQFGIHTDTGCINHATKSETGYVLLIYLNDNFSGGETTFYDDKFQLLETITPATGTAVLFAIDMLHAGNTVTQGEKYWCGADIMIPFTYDISHLKY